ncbi:MAG TPA: hypothetical protein VGP76_03380 [Planctomycetaceae bacterium]|jgi:hypothetical protein|nr:hypothetical protein [Planctomycetaceae bacterium]
MSFVVKVTLDSGPIVWASTRWPDGSRSLVSIPEVAAVFQAEADALAAIPDLPWACRAAETELEIEPLE